MTKNLILLLSLVSVSGCYKSSTPSTPLARQLLMVQNEQTSLNLSAFIDDYTTIPLPNEIMFSEVQAIQLYKGHYYIQTSENEALLKIDKDGRLLNLIETTSSREGGLSAITSFDIYEDKIFVLDRDFQRVSILDLHLKLRSTIRLPFYAQSLKITSENIGLFYLGNELSDQTNSKFVSYDFINERVIFQELQISNVQRKYFNFLTRNHFFRLDDQLYGWDAATEKVFSFNSNGAEPMYKLDLGEASVANDFYNETSFENAYEFITHMRKNEYSYRPFKIISYKNYLYLLFEHQGGFWSSIYRLDTDKSVSFANLNDDLITDKPLDEAFLQLFVPSFGTEEIIIHLPSEYMANSQEYPNGILMTGKINDTFLK